MLFNYIDHDGRGHLVLTATEGHEKERLMDVVKNINERLHRAASDSPEATKTRFAVLIAVDGDYDLEEVRTKLGWYN